MHVIHSKNQLLKEPARFILFETSIALFIDVLEQVSTGSEFHGNAKMRWRQKHLRFQASKSHGRIILREQLGG